MSDSFDTPFSSSECDSLLGGVVRPLTKRKNIEGFQKQARDPANAWHPGRRSNARTNNGLDTFSGLFVYVYLSFIPTHLQGKNEKIRDYPDGWYHADGRKISIAKDTELERFFHVALVEPKPPFRTDDLSFEGRSLYDAVAQHMQARWLTALGLLLAFDEGPGNGGKRFSKGQELEREELEREASSLTVQYNGQTCSKSFVESVLEIYAKNVCGAILEEKEPCPHCGEQKVEKKPCLNCGIVGDSWTCPFCGTRTDVTKLPNHGTKGMYCPTDGCHLPVVRGGELLEKFRAASRKPLAAALEELRALQRECLGISVELSWTRLVDQIARLEAASTALGRIDTAVEAKNIHDADEALRAAKSEYPDLDYTGFERRIAVLKVSAAEREIQGLLNAGKIDEASGKTEESSGISGFDANKWRGKIREKRAKQERQRKIEDKKQEFDAAWGNQEWEKAKRIGRELAGLGEKSESYWNGEIERHKQSLKQDLGKTRDDALAAFSEALGRNDVLKARAELGKAKAAQEKLHAQFGGSVTVPRIAEGERKLAELEKRVALEGLRPVRELAAAGSADGSPVVRVVWKAAVEGTSAAGWRLLRRRRSEGGEGEQLGDVRVPGYEDRGGRLKVGVEYEYGVVPLVEEAGSGGQKVLKANKNAVAWSAVVVCRAKLAADALTGRGEGEAGQWGLVTLSWQLPAGLDVRERNVKLELSRSDGRFRGKDVTGLSGFEDDAVEVGRSYEYMLELSIAGQASGRSAKRVAVETQPPPEAVRNLRVRRLSGGRSFSGGSTWLATWDWPTGEDRVLLVQSEGELENPERPALASDAQVVEKGDYEKRQGAEVFVRRGMRRLTALSFKEKARGRRKFAAGTWTGVTTETAEIGVEIVAHRGGVFRRGADTEVFVSSSTGELPALAVVAGNGRRPQRMADGRKLAELPPGPAGSGGKMRIAVPGDVPPETIRVFLADPNGDAERFRLAPARVRG